MSSLIKRKDVVLVAKGQKKPSNYGNGGSYRWYTLYDPASKEVIRISGTSKYEFRLFSICDIEYRSETQEGWNLTYDKFRIKNMMGAGIIPTRPLEVCNDSNLPRKVKGTSIQYFDSYDQ